MKRLVLSIIFCVAVFFISSLLDYAYTTYYIQHRTFRLYLGYIDTLQLALWLPTILLYGLFGWFLPNLIRSHERKWMIAIVIFIMALELYLTHHYFTEYADLVDKAWSYFSYVVPSLSVFAGYTLRAWLTKSSSGKSMESVSIDN